MKHLSLLLIAAVSLGTATFAACGPSNLGETSSASAGYGGQIAGTSSSSASSTSSTSSTSSSTGSGSICTTPCNIDADCQNTCPAPASGSLCCDTTNAMCFTSPQATCPGSTASTTSSSSSGGY